MTVPSYDDLTPGIPDDVDAKAAGSLASLLLPASGSRLPASSSALPASSSRLPTIGSPLPATLFACLRAAGGQHDGVMAIARDFSPRIKRVSDAEVLLDVSGLGRLIGEPPEIARQLRRAIDEARLQASVAVAPTQTMARVLTHAETKHGSTLRHEDHGACGRGPWRQLPVDLLRELEVLPPGINHRDRDRPYEIFATWGIATLGDLAALPPGDLSSRLGRRGVALHRLARGLDPAPFVPDAETPRYLGRLELEWPIDGLEPLSFVFARLLDPLATALERADRGAAAIRLDLRLTDRSTHTRVLQLPAAMRDPRVLRTLLLLDLESHPLFAAASEVMVDVVAIELDPAPARITQFSLLQRALPSPETLSTLTARLSALVGDTRVGSPVVLDSHAPDALAMTRYAPEGPPSPPFDDGSGHPELRRGTLRGFGETGLPATESRPVLRRCRGSIALHVSVERGRPVHIASSRRGVPYGAIVQAAGPWRASGGWWITSVPRPGSGRPELESKGEGSGPWSRNEWDVALHSGAVCRIYQDRVTDRWFLEGVYD